ncbi:MAG: aminotransferase class I/II-fold pyridoxal phosphate-dependent enzyme [Candidatus Dormibacteraeota bacterium]|nr:aminotransferase class I/II-fold pyridoxal phosphate-dependent enzyme [Candidatus Dormibacteraeota bacterium]MBV9525443.1 aminotransferase class I/II-fold pyridoxal phosphate-dependent enzyme [Candidatus Dormibacteraeota bacterium]
MNVTTRYHIAGRRATDIAASVERGIRDGAITPGSQLPPVRRLAGRLGVSAATVASAYRELRLRGLIIAAGRQGTTVVPRGPVAPRGKPQFAPGIRDLTGGNPDPALLPALAPHLAAIDAESVMYGTAPSEPALLELAAARFEEDGVPAEHMTVVGGALDGIELVIGAHLRPGDRVAVEDPCYPGFSDLAAVMGLVSVPMAVDDRGPVPQAMAAALRAGAAACVVTPRAQNPFGAALMPERAAELRAVLRRFPDVLVVEDEHARDITGGGGGTLSDARRERWAQVRSVSKALGPDLRMAVVSGDATTVSRVEGRRLLGAGWVSHLLQRLVVSLWRDPATAATLAEAARTYDTRRDALLLELRARGVPCHGSSGLNVWVPVAHEGAVVASLLQGGWGVLAGERFRIAAPRGLRITTSTLEPAEGAKLAADLEAAIAPAPGRLA